MFRQTVSDLTVKFQPRVYTPAEEEKERHYRQGVARKLREFAARFEGYDSHTESLKDQWRAVQMVGWMPPEIK